MSYIPPRGSPNNPLWIILERPLSTDTVKNELLSGGLGYVFEKMLTEARLSLSDCYVVARRGDLDKPGDFYVSDFDYDQFHPPLLLVLDEAGGFFLPDELKIKGEFSRGQLQKYAGSLLQSKMLQYPHYMMPIYGPQYCVADWTERNVTTYVDLQKMRDELEYWKKNKILKSLPERELKYGNFELDEILRFIDRFKVSSILSVDIETVYPRAGSAYLPHPGYPITIGIADGTSFGVSFNLFRDIPGENRILWRALSDLFDRKRILGQNFFNFDSLFLESLGFRIDLQSVQDTLIRHHILWPELSHKLQFMTRQYTREPFYKDEGHHWSIKHMDRLRRYNCLDVCVTYEIYEQQEEEFKQRPHLR